MTTGIGLVIECLIVAACMAVGVPWFARDLRKAGGWKKYYTELTGIILPPKAAPVPEVRGHRGWTADKWADPRYGAHPVTGEPVLDERAAVVRGRVA